MHTFFINTSKKELNEYDVLFDIHYENILNDNHRYEFRYIDNTSDTVVFNYSIEQGLKYKNWEQIREE